jgi:hypothetical protein
LFLGFRLQSSKLKNSPLFFRMGSKSPKSPPRRSSQSRSNFPAKRMKLKRSSSSFFMANRYFPARLHFDRLGVAFCFLTGKSRVSNGRMSHR